MDQLTFIQWSAALTGLAFIFAFGAIVGSFINVLAYRLPKGLNVVTPPSACPACATRLTWRENIPIVGWIALGGKCRFCKSRISMEYPIVEAVVAGLFALAWVLWFMEPSPLPMLGLSPGYWRPNFAIEGIVRMWPMLVIAFTLIGSLVASTLIDARTFTIPLMIPWCATAVGFVVHPLHAWMVQTMGGMRLSSHPWTIPLVEGGGVGLAIGGVAGLVLSIVLMRRGALPQSFADYPEWEARAIEAEKAAEQAHAMGNEGVRDADGGSIGEAFKRSLLLTGPAIALMFLGVTIGLRMGHGLALAGAGAGIGLVVGLILRRLGGSSDMDSHEPVWTRYPHARREMMKEVLFLVPCLALGWLGWWLTRSEGLLGAWVEASPLWVRALAASSFGYLMGGGIVWLFRIGGSLALGKEAMGLGDVHLMAAAGACLGWIDPLLGFFAAPFFGIGWTILGVFFRQFFHRQGTALPYGPHLAAATVLVLLFKPVFESVLSAIMSRPIDIP